MIEHEQRSNTQVSYTLDGDVLTVSVDGETVEYAFPTEDGFFQYPPYPIRRAERVGGTLHVEVIRTVTAKWEPNEDPTHPNTATSGSVDWLSWPSAADIEPSLLAEIDAKASVVRERFITQGTGQEATYLEKYEEAKAYKAATDPVASDYPLLDAESTRRGLNMTELADEVIARRTSWIDPSAAQVEAERVGGKQDVRAASTVADKEVARDDAIAALEAIQP